MHRNAHRHTRPRAHTQKIIFVFLHFRFDFTCRSKCLQHFWNYLSSSSLSYFSPFLLLLPSSPHCFLLILNYFSLFNPIASFFFSLSSFVLFYSSLSSTLFYSFAFSCPSFIHHFAFFTFFSLSSFVFFILFSLTVIFYFLYSFFTSSSSSPCFLLFLLALSLSFFFFLHYFLSFSSYIFLLFLLLTGWWKRAFNFLWFTAIIENNADLKKNKTFSLMRGSAVSRFFLCLHHYANK